ncbi:MAG: ferritin family protein [Candidatus Helarchaeota archaeon]|nr:ferritin family protein [Candidatus Helarchaeota archaeon]
MSYPFNADEIFEAAEQIERNGAKFYRDAAAKVAEEAHKKLLNHLAEMEDDHEKTFKAMRSELSDKEKALTAFDPEGETAAYLRALADTRIFYKKDIDLSSMKEILKAAITAEKDSIVFYLGMKDVVPEKLGKGKLDGIIKEEMDHIRQLSQELLALPK